MFSRDFSIFSLFTAGLACLVPFTSAYTKPVGAEPKGNPIYTPGLHTIVPVGKGYTVTWKPTTQGTITLVLLKGPSDNAVPQYPIVQNLPNTGNFIWVPKDNLVPSDGDTGYGIQLIDDATGQYQYTTQFGISNPNYNNESSSSTSSGTASAPSGYTAPTGGHGGSPNGTHAHPTGWKPHNATTPHPTGYHTKPMLSTSTSIATQSSSVPTPSAPAPSPAQTGAATTLATSFVGLVFAAGVAVFAL